MMELYRCTICDHTHEGELTEDFKCPKCNQPRSVFEPKECKESEEKDEKPKTER
ncbi:MAG: rubredoxin-like domain-containing protein [Anaerovoracaceae bacterium]